MYGLEMQNLTVDFGSFKMNVTANIRRGCITGLVGRNGAGKSTLIKTIMRQQNADCGTVLYNGKRFKEDAENILLKTACVFDTPHFNTNYKPTRILSLFKAIYADFDEELYNTLMRRFNLPSDRRINKFSFGMQRKYCLILALCQKPDILILDEPTSGIDPYDRGNVVELIQEFMMDENHTVLFSTHITEDLDKIADYIVMMENGSVTIDEDKESLIENYRIVQCPEITEELRRVAIGVQKSMFGYTFLTKEKNLQGEVSYEDECSLIEGDYDRVRQLFTILLQNAVKYSHTGTKISVHIERANSMIIAAVRDFGSVIPQEEWENVFDKFYRASNHGEKEGSGLGLVVAKNIVERHKGKIYVRSDNKSGTCFTIEFPETSENIS